MKTVQQLFQNAQQYQKNNQPNQAWECYQKILQLNPNHFPTQLAMANLLFRQKAYKKAIEIYEYLLQLQPFNVDITYRCGMAHLKLEEAKAIPYLQKVLKIMPQENKRLKQTVQLQLAKAYLIDKKIAEAKKLTNNLVKQNPDNESALSLLAELYQKEGDNNNALTLFTKVIDLVPNNAGAHLNLGVIHITLEQIKKGIHHLKIAQDIKPNWEKPYQEMATAYLQIGRANKAIQSLKKALQINPKGIETYRKMVYFYQTQGNHKNTIENGIKLLALSPKDREILINVGLAYSLLGQIEKGLKYYQKAYELEADAKTAFIIASCHNFLKDLDQADDWYQKTLEHQANHYAATYHLLFRKMEYCDWTNRANDEKKLIETITQHIQSQNFEIDFPSLYFNYFDFPIAAHRMINEFLSQAGQQRIDLLKKQTNFNHQPRNRKLIHVAYMSSDFRDHPVGRLVASLFQHHDREKVKVFTYFLTPFEAENEYAQRIKAGSDVSKNFAFSGTVAAAQQIYADEIDILVDLTGHTANNRIDILRLQPAPIQTHCIGYPNTMGLKTMQYILADKFLAPKQLQSFYTEKIIHLPSAFLGNRPIIMEQPLSRTELGLPEEAIVFVGFNRSSKIEPALFNSWMNILKAVDNSVLWLSDLLPKARINLQKEAVSAGVKTNRLIFSPKRSYPIYLKSHQLADLFLDTWHYSAGSTAIAALGAGLPVITCVDENNASRMGASIIAAAGLEDLICKDLESYQVKAIELAKNPTLLQKYKMKLAPKEKELLLFDNLQFAKNLENTFEQLREDWKQSFSSIEPNL